MALILIKATKHCKGINCDYNVRKSRPVAKWIETYINIREVKDGSYD